MSNECFTDFYLTNGVSSVGFGTGAAGVGFGTGAADDGFSTGRAGVGFGTGGSIGDESSSKSSTF